MVCLFFTFFMSKKRKSFAFSLPIKVADHLRREAREYWLAREQRLVWFRLGQEMLCDVEVNGGGTIVKGKNCNNNNNDNNNRQ